MPRKFMIQHSVLQSRKGSKDRRNSAQFDPLKDLSLPKFARHGSIDKTEESSKIERVSYINVNEPLIKLPQSLSLINGEQHPMSAKETGHRCRKYSFREAVSDKLDKNSSRNPINSSRGNTSIFEPELEPDGVIIVKAKKPQNSGAIWHEQLILNMENRSDSIFDQAGQSDSLDSSRKEIGLDQTLQSLRESKELTISEKDTNQPFSISASSTADLKLAKKKSSVQQNYLDEQILESDLVCAIQPPMKIQMVPPGMKKHKPKASASPPVVVKISLQPVL